MKNRILVAILPVLACFAFLPGAQAVCQDGCDNSLFNAFQGDDALINNTSGLGNTAFGWRALFSETDGSFNTGVGGGALPLNTSGVPIPQWALQRYCSTSLAPTTRPLERMRL